MDKELKILSKYQEFFPAQEVSALVEMEKTKRMWDFQKLFDRLVKEKKHEQARKIGKIIYYEFGIDLSNNGI